MAQQIRNGLHRHIPAHHLGREGVSKHVGAPPRNGDASAAQRSLGDIRHVSADELPIRGPSRCEDPVRRAGRGPRAQRGDQGLPDVGGQWQPSLPSSFAGYTTVPLCQSMSIHREGRDLACPQAKPDQQQQDGAVTKPARARHVHRGQHPLDVFAATARGSAACVHWRMVGTAPSMPAGITPRVARKRKNARVAVTGLRRVDGPSRLACVCTNAAIVGTVSRDQSGVGVPAHSARRAAA